MSPLSSSSQLSSSAWRGLPSVPGVYIYKDSSGKIIYVGKAKNLKNRVSSYFQPPARLGPKTQELVSRITSLEYIEVNSETEALLLESRLIKKFKPFYNIISKDDKSPYYVHLTREEYPMPIINHDPQGALAGPFLNSLIPRRILRQFRRVAPFCVAPRPVKKPCFYSHIGLCNPCPALGQKQSYAKNISRLKRLIQGNFTSVRSALASEMAIASKRQDFESAAQIRDQINSLDYLLSQPVMPDEYIINPNLAADTRDAALSSLQHLLQIESLHRIEMYDNAHLSGTDATSAMVVAINGQPNSSQYRHFTIKKAQSNSDVDMMKEVLSRRLKRADWATPSLIVLDGGVPQLSIVSQLFKELGSPIPLVSLAKRNEILIVPAGDGYKEVEISRSDPGLRLIQQLRDEAHRFSRRLHHQHRSKSLLK